jgi:hypothetical protein
VFARWRWDGAQLVIESRPYGFYPLFYHSTPDEFTVSSSILALLDRGVPSELDLNGLAAFLHLGFFLGEDTPFKAIRAMPPSGRLTWRPGEAPSPGPDPTPPAACSLSRPEAIEAYATAFRSAITRAAPRNRFAVPLSGGRDSRHILFELLAQGHQPTFAITARHFPERPDEDVQVAAALAAHVGIPHRIVEQSSSRSQAELLKNRLTNFCSDEHAWGLPMREALRGQVSEIYDGIGGDILSAGLFLDMNQLAAYRAGRLREVAEGLMSQRNGLDPLPPRALRPALSANMSREASRERIILELSRYQAAHNPLVAFYFFNRTRREVTLFTLGLFGDFLDVLCPYLDPTVLSLLMSLPAEMIASKSFHSDTIAAAYPQHRYIPYEDKSVRRVVPRSYVRRFCLETLMYAILHARSRTVNVRSCVPRLIAGALSGDSERLSWPNLVLITYFIQVGACQSYAP